MKFRLVIIALASGVAAVSTVATVNAQSIDAHLVSLDAAVERTRSLERNPNFKRANLSGAARNVVALSDRWESVRAALAQFEAPPVSSVDTAMAEAAIAVAFGPRPISNATLSVSRYTGFTQSETTTAWCGSSVVVGFHDTGSEIKSLLASTGLTALGVAFSKNRGGAYSYRGSPTPALSFTQEMRGNPSLVCADANNFFYSSIWADDLNDLTGVAVAKSIDGGNTFAAPAVAIGKSSITHFINRDWLTIDHANTGDLYITYVDIDFSATVCGVDGFNQPIVRYAIELVASSDGGVSWSAKPTVVEEVCADPSHPNLAVDGPQVAVGPSGEVYVTWEAMGETTGALTDREIKLAKSIDRGASFAIPVKVASVTPIGDGADLQGFIRAGEFPAIAIGQSKSTSGFLYLTWATASFSVPDALSTTGQYGFADVMVAQSQDGGTTWSSPERVNNNAEGGAKPLSDQFDPAIGTDKTGRIAICFYDRRRDPNNFLIDRYCASSNDLNKSWSNARISPVNFPALVGQDVLVAPDFMAEYDSVASDALGQHAGFIESFSGNAAGNPDVMTNHF